MKTGAEDGDTASTEPPAVACTVPDHVDTGSLPSTPVHHVTLRDLRTDIRLAIVSSFEANFGAYLGHDLEIDRLENDLLQTGDDGYAADYACQLTLSLSYEKNITMDTYLARLRREFMRRERDFTILGNDRYEADDEDGPKPWESLTADTKIHVLWRLCEWHTQDSERFRNRIGLSDDLATWRDEPVGEDGAGNAYWYFYDGRLWVHRGGAPTKPPKKPREKRRKAPKREAKVIEPKTPLPPTATGKRKRASRTSGSSGPGLGRDSPKLSERERRAASRAAPKRPRLGTRASNRLGGTDDDGWQAVPEEWLSPAKTNTAISKAKGKSKVIDTDDSSSVLSSLSSHPSSRASSPATVIPEKHAVSDVEMDDESEDSSASESEADIQGVELIEAVARGDPSWCEWEVCAAAEDWQDLVEKLSHTQNLKEKALRAFIEDEAMPSMAAEAEARLERKREAEQEALEEAERLAAEAEPEPRKRSSRIAAREADLMIRQRLELELDDSERVLRGGRTTRHSRATPTDDGTREGRLRRREEERRERELQEALLESQALVEDEDDSANEVYEWEEDVQPIAPTATAESEAPVSADRLDEASIKLESMQDRDSLGVAPQSSLKVILKRSPSLSPVPLPPEGDRSLDAIHDKSARALVSEAKAVPPSGRLPKAETETVATPATPSASMASPPTTMMQSPPPSASRLRMPSNLPSVALTQGVGTSQVKSRQPKVKSLPTSPTQTTAETSPVPAVTRTSASPARPTTSASPVNTAHDAPLRAAYPGQLQLGHPQHSRFPQMAQSAYIPNGAQNTLWSSPFQQPFNQHPSWPSTAQAGPLNTTMQPHHQQHPRLPLPQTQQPQTSAPLAYPYHANATASVNHGSPPFPAVPALPLAQYMPHTPISYPLSAYGIPSPSYPLDASNLAAQNRRMDWQMQQQGVSLPHAPPNDQAFLPHLSSHGDSQR